MTRTTSSRPRSRRTALAVALGGSALLTLAGCGGASGAASGGAGPDAVRANGSIDTSHVTLVVGDQKGGSQALLQAAGELKNLPYKISWKTFTSGPPLLEALNAGAIDIGGVGNTPPLFAAAGNSRMTVVSADTQGGKGDSILVPKGSPIHSVAQLRGKTVAVAEGSSANYNLLAQLKKAGLSYSDVTVDNLQPADALAAFTSGHVDAWAVWDPYTSQAEIQAHARVLADGVGVVNGYGFEAADPASLQDPAKAAAIKDYITRLAKAQLWSNTHKPAWARVWAQDTGLPPAVALAAVDRRTATPIPIDHAVISSEQHMADAFVAAHLLPSSFDVAPFFSSRFNTTVPHA